MNYLLELACFNHSAVAVLFVGQPEQDVVSDVARHDPGSLGGVGDTAAVSDSS